MLDPSRIIATATSPLGEIAKPSGPSPTTTRSVIRGGLSSRSTTLTVSTLPSDWPLLPLSAVRAILPLGATATLYGQSPVAIELALGHFVTIDVEQRNLVIVEFGHQRVLAIGREDGV